MPKQKHKDVLIEEWKKNIIQQIVNNFHTTGVWDPFSAKMPDVSIQFKNIFNKINENTVIYRFFPFERFKELIEKKQLAFISPLKYEDDEKEAECMEAHRLFVYKYLIYLYQSNQLDFIRAGLKKTMDMNIDLMSVSARWDKIFQYCRRNVFVSCWTLNNPESSYMWKQYTNNNTDAVAIQTTIKNFQSALAETGHGVHYIDKVKYVDWQEYSIDETSHKYIKTLDALRYSLFHKQKRFEQDNELRIAIDNLTCNTTPWYIENTNTILGHKDFDYDQYFEDNSHPKELLKEKISLNHLIEKIYLSPFVTDKDYKKIKELLSINNLFNKNTIANKPKEEK